MLASLQGWHRVLEKPNLAGYGSTMLKNAPYGSFTEIIAFVSDYDRLYG